MGEIVNSIKKVITGSKTYGAPDDTISWFISIFYDKYYVKAANALEEIKGLDTEEALNNEFLRMVEESPQEERSQYTFTGGYDFYYKLIKSEPKTKDDVRQFILNYERPESIKLNINILNIIKASKCDKIYIGKQADNKKYYILVYNDGRLFVYNDNNSMVGEASSVKIVNYLLGLKYKKLYLGSDINRFVCIPSNTLTDYELYRIRLQITDDLLRRESSNAVGKVAQAMLNSVPHSDKADYADKSGAADISEQSLESGSSTSASKSNTADVAKELSEEGVNKVVNEFIERLKTDDDILDLISSRTEQLIAERDEKKKWEYKVIEYNKEFNTLDIYNDEQIEQALSILENSHRLLISGDTGSGKSELANYIAHIITGENISSRENTGSLSGAIQYDRVCITSARSGVSIVCGDDAGDVKAGDLAKFIKHINDTNNSDKCVFICNEVQAADFGWLIGGKLWEQLNNTGIPSETVLPSNLYLIFTGCKNRDFGIDRQITERVKTICIDYISEKNTEMLEKINRNIIEKTSPVTANKLKSALNLIAKINDNEGYSFISFRVFKHISENIINGKVMNDSDIKEINVSIAKQTSKELIARLKELCRI